MSKYTINKSTKYNMQLFDEEKIAKARQEAAPHLKRYDFLIRAVEQDLKDRTQTYTQTFNSVLLHGSQTEILQDLFSPSKLTSLSYPHESSEILNMADSNYDLVADCLTFHTTHNLQEILKTYYRLLKPGGVFIAAFYGGETLTELRDSLLQTEIALTGGASLRVIPMIDLSTALALLQHAGFKEPIVDREINHISYSSLTNLLRDIKGMGEHRPFMEPPSPISYRHFKQAADFYRNHYSDQSLNKIKATAEVIYMHGIKGL